MDKFTRDINKTANSILNPIFANEYVTAITLLVLVLYSSYWAPRVPLSTANVIFNPWFRFGMLAFIAYMFKAQPATAIMLAVALYVTQTYLMKNTFDQVQQTGQLTQDFLRMVVGSPVPGIQNASQINAQGVMLQSELSNKNATGQFKDGTPQAVLSSTSGPTTVSNISIDTVPSGTPANAQTMMEQTHPMSSGPGGLLNNNPGSNIPAAYVPSEIMSVASAPRA